MKKVLILAVALIFVFSGMAFASVIGTKHDMTSTGGAGFDGSIKGGGASGTTSQVCVFCHHPHKTGASAADATVLWNRNGSTAMTKTYGIYDAAVITNDSLKGSATAARNSRVCLSCHDSTVGITVVDTTPIASSLGAGYTDNRIGAAAQTNIGGDGGAGGLENDHPVDFSYTYVQGVNNEFPAPGATTGHVETGTNTWKLYGGTMQCLTCHDPHNSDAAAGVLFIRNSVSGTNDPLQGSQMCADCHRQH